MAPSLLIFRKEPTTRAYFAVTRISQAQHKISPRQPHQAQQASAPFFYTNTNTSFVPTSQTSSRRPSNLSIAVISAGSFALVLLGLVFAFLVYKRHRLSFSSAFKCCRRPRKVKKAPVPSHPKGVLLDDHNWGTGPTRIVYVESVHAMLHDYDHPPGSFQSVSLATDTDLHGLGASSEKLVVEERDITTGYVWALSDWERRHSLFGNVEQEASSVINVQLFQSVLEDGNHKPSKGITLRARNRQASDASDSSDSSQETTGSDIAECFSPATSASSSSMTSIASMDDDVNDDEHYEVRRAQTQSIEFKRGVLLAWQANGALTDVLASESAPTVVIWQPPTGMVLDSETSRSITSLQTSCSGPPSLSQCQTIPSLSSSLLPENSTGTVNSLDTSYSASARSLCTDDDGYLLPPVPYLMVTRPSNSSICTLSSATSSVSIDLNDFPLPPLPAKPLRLKLLDKIHGRRCGAQVNDTNAVQKRRSTVEQLVMMYAAA